MKITIGMQFTSVLMVGSWIIAGCNNAPEETASNAANIVAVAPTPTLMIAPPPPMPTEPGQIDNVSHECVVRVVGIPSSPSASSQPWMIKIGTSPSNPKTPLPFNDKTRKMTGETLGIYVQNDGWDRGKIRAEVEVDGKVVASEEGTGVPLLGVSYRIPSKGATALCRDDTFYFSPNRQGACSDHKGVEYFYTASGSKN